MASELTQSQSDTYERAKQSIASELNEETLSWDFSKMLDQLEAAITSKSPTESGATRNAVRFFCRHYLNMRGESFHEARHWLSGKSPMLEKDIQLVLRTLKALGDATFLEIEIQQQPKNGDEHDSCRALAAVEISVAELPTNRPGSGVIRKLIDHTISLFNSLVGLIVESGVAPADVYDGDRMQIRGALQKICDAFAITVVFPEPNAARNQPVTREDLSDIGLPRRKRKGKAKS